LSDGKGTHAHVKKRRIWIPVTAVGKAKPVETGPRRRILALGGGDSSRGPAAAANFGAPNSEIMHSCGRGKYARLAVNFRTRRHHAAKPDGQWRKFPHFDEVPSLTRAIQRALVRGTIAAHPSFMRAVVPSAPSFFPRPA
jgi:hypothetical protein